MNKLWVFVIAAVAGLCSTSEAKANWFGCDAVLRAYWSMFYPPEPAHLHTTVTFLKPEWREEKIERVVPCWNCREVVEKVVVQISVPKWEDGKLCRWDCEDRIIERKRTEWYATPQNVTEVRRYCVMVPYSYPVCIPTVLPHYGPPVCPWGW